MSQELETESDYRVDREGVKRWVLKGTQYIPHRVDGPAIVDPKGREWWFRYGVLYRENGPALVDPFMGEYWFVENGRLDTFRRKGVWEIKNGRIVGAFDFELKIGAQEEMVFHEKDSDGHSRWYLKGRVRLPHRLDGPAVKENDSEREWWMQYGLNHRVDGPAIINGSQQWWQWHGLRHRDDGPAYHSHRGDAWGLYDEAVDEKQYAQWQNEKERVKKVFTEDHLQMAQGLKEEIAVPKKLILQTRGVR